jgi:endonuclease/exonuclease/phosphatase family metal-dependent hydrolase
VPLRSLLPLILLTVLSLYALFSFAGDDTPDALGCVVDEITSNYRCETGPLAGREFMSAEEARATLEADAEKKAKDKEDEAFAATYTVPLKLMSWNFNSIGTKRFEYDRIAQILSEADFIAMQEVEFSANGETSLTVIADILSRRLNQRICKGWFKNSVGGRARHAFLWKDKVISYVEKNGSIADRCPDAPVVIRIDGSKIDPNEPYMATFFLKTRRQMFNAVSIQLGKKPKKAAKEITAVFAKLSQLPWPAVVAGNFKVGAGDKAFTESKRLSFKPVMARSGGATSNVWTKNLNIVHAEAVDLHERFSDLKPVDVDQTISDFPPILAEISFSAEEADALRMQLVKRSARGTKTAAKGKLKSAPAKPMPAPLPVHDDLEKEAAD